MTVELIEDKNYWSPKIAKNYGAIELFFFFLILQ